MTRQQGRVLRFRHPERVEAFREHLREVYGDVRVAGFYGLDPALLLERAYPELFSSAFRDWQVISGN